MTSDARAGAAPFVPPEGGLERLRGAASGCRGCDLYRAATQTVFGAGDPDARMMLVGEQPGDQEDRQGAPFVGPAGRVLGEALEDVRVERAEVYLTNVVKHFRFARAGRGKRRLHKPPTSEQVRACRPWLLAELRLVAPDVVVCLGATAAKSLFGTRFRLSENRGAVLRMPELDGTGHPRPPTVTTIHPSAVLRADDRDGMYAGLVAVLGVAVQVLARS